MNKDKYVERFLGKTVQAGNGCWIWKGGTYKTKYGVTYGQAQWNGVRTGAHRVSWMLFVGPLPDAELDHTCEIKLCVNPAHLQPVTHAENKRLAAERRTFCRSGLHPWVPENITTVGKKRMCRLCFNAYHRDFRKKNPGWKAADRARIRDALLR